MTDHSWVSDSLRCSIKRFQRLLYGTPTKIMLDKGQVGRDYWKQVQNEKETARKLTDLLFTYNLYENYDY